MLRDVRILIHKKLVRIVKEGAEWGTASLRDDVRHLSEQLTENEARVEYLRHQLQHVERRNLSLAADRLAVDSSAAWALENMPQALRFPDKLATLRHAIGEAPTNGMALEFGVYTGATLRTIVEDFDGREVFGFDSFEGLPENWRTGFPAGTFDVDGIPTVVGAEVVVGWYHDVLPGFLDEHSGPVTFLHVDCDLYSSTVTVLEHVGPRLVPGSVIVFDEYFNYPGWQDGEHLAWQEYVAKTGTSFTYLGYTLEDEQVAVQIAAPPR